MSGLSVQIQAGERPQQQGRHEQAEPKHEVGARELGGAGQPGGTAVRATHRGPHGAATGLATDLACALDPTQLARQAGLAPDPWQVAALRSTADRALWNVSRQAGKSSTAAVLAVHQAVYVPDSLVLLLSPSLRQSAELFRKVIDVHSALGDQPTPDAETLLRLELPNGSRVVSLPAKESTVRGFSKVRLLIVDEAGRVPDPLYFSVRPMLAVSGGRLLALSTPAGKRGWWYDAWHGAAAWERVEVPATACPRIAAAFLAEERASLPQWIYEQEYACQFHEADGAVFRHADIAAAFSPAVRPLFPVGTP